MTTDRLRTVVNAALDDRRDPLEDDAVLAALVDEPERVAEVDRIVRAVRAVERTERVGTARARRAGASIAAEPRATFEASSPPSTGVATTRGRRDRGRASFVRAAAALVAIAAIAALVRLASLDTRSPENGAPTVADDVAPSGARDAVPTPDATFGPRRNTDLVGAGSIATNAGHAPRVVEWRFTFVSDGPEGRTVTVRDASGTRHERSHGAHGHGPSESLTFITRSYAWTP